MRETTLNSTGKRKNSNMKKEGHAKKEREEEERKK